MGCDQRLGAEADEVAGPGPFRVDGPRNRSHHDVGVGHHLARILAAHAFRSLGRRLLIRPALRGLGEVVGGDVPPFGFDSAGFDEHDVNAELGRLHAQRVRKGLHRVLCSVVPASHERDEPPAHARDVDDRARSPLAHLGHDGLRQSGEAEDVDVELAARFVDLDVFDRSEGSVARVVHQHVDAPAFGDDPPDGVLARLLVGDVKLDGVHAVFGERRHPFDAPGCAVDGMALQGQLFRRLEPHAAACAGDEDCLLVYGFDRRGFLRHRLPFM